MLGAAGEDDSDDESDNPAPTVRRSGRTWAPTQQTLESQEQHWEPHGVQVDHTPEPPPPERQPVDAEPEVEEPMPAEEEGLKVQAPPLELRPIDLVLAPVPDHQDVRMDTEGEGLGEPDPLVLARSPEDMSPRHTVSTSLDLENKPRSKIEIQCWQESKTGYDKAPSQEGWSWTSESPALKPTSRLCQSSN